MIFTEFTQINKKYDVIYMDPPWSYNNYTNIPYETQSDDFLLSLDIDKITNNDSVIFMWITAPKLKDFFDKKIFDKWGFTYKTIAFTWIKTSRYDSKKFPWGMGNYTRSNPEYVLVATKGSLKVKSHSVHSVVLAPKERHSRKPPIIRNKIVELFGENTTRLEMFARETFFGWDAFGNEFKKGEQFT